MTKRISMRCAFLITAAIFAAGFHAKAAAPKKPAGAPSVTMTLDVDATDAPRKILHATMSTPAKPGVMTLFYPKWIPGEHQPSGPIANLAGLHVFADGKEIEWRRDLIEMYAVHVHVPAGAKIITATYDYVVPMGGSLFGSQASTNAKIAVVNWYTVCLYPQGEPDGAITVTASLKAPPGWKHGGSLDVASVEGDTIRYAPTSLEMLIDHPVILGAHFRSIPLWAEGSPPGEHAIDMVADDEWALQLPQARIDAFKRTVLEERAVFGGVGHYRKYHWLLTLSDTLGSFGVEHHECADDRLAENTFVDDDAAKRASLLLPHEYFHSWCGKAMRPAGQVTGGYERPMRDDLLWVYEGLTNYYGEVLSARAGLITLQDLLDEIASDAMWVSHTGRLWRTVQDSADAAPFLYAAGGGWMGWRRQGYQGEPAFYDEGTLIWLEADVIIRRQTGGRRTLDDFCAAFIGRGDNGKVWVKPYEADDVYAALNAVAPNDWKGFFEKRLQSKNAELPLGGVEGAGYRMVFNETPNVFIDPWALDGSLNACGSLGIRVLADGTVDDAWPGRPAFEGGLGSGMKIVAVNGRRFSVDLLKRALGASKDAAGPMEFIVDNAGYFQIVRVDYHGGLRYPHLERIPGTDDLLAVIAAPRAASEPSNPGSQ